MPFLQLYECKACDVTFEFLHMGSRATLPETVPCEHELLCDVRCGNYEGFDHFHACGRPAVLRP